MKTTIITALAALTTLVSVLAGDPTPCPALTRIRFYPAEGPAARMLRGRFNGSNEGAATGFVSLVHYAYLFGESPEGKVSPLNSGLKEEQAAAFQRMAWKSVESSLSVNMGR